MILVTGACGFIARHVIALLKERGMTVLGVDSLDARVHPSSLIPMWWDVNDPLFVGPYVQTPEWMTESCDAIIHLAAQVSVADSTVDPLRYIFENSADTAAFLMKCPPKRLVVASSMSVYGEGGKMVREKDTPVCPTSVYGLTKYDQERLCLIWGDQHRVPITALRFFNVYGPGQALTNPYTGVLANFAQRILRGERPLVYEDGLQTRDFVHVSDVATAVVTALTESKGGVYNVCTGKPTTIAGAAQGLATAMGRHDLAPEITGQVRPGDIRHCTGDPVRALMELDFQAEIPFARGVVEYGKALMS